ncbi:PucR family transcriptional regulator [Spirillospora sp. CA-294931]|uniref:PucR family transcriptional regulator n=1 Tax=Spirillospora sp. CA-294931 TaxID=3240042 RepID=UPI003D8E8E95
MENRLVQEMSVEDVTAVLELLSREMPQIVAEAVREIESQLPQYTRIRDPEHVDFLPNTVERALRGFFEVMVDRDAPLDDLLVFFREVGRIEALEGLSRETSHTAFWVGAGLAIRRQTEIAEAHPAVNARVIGTVTEAVLGYLNQIEGAVSEGHADTEARAVGDLRIRREALIDLMIEPGSSVERVEKSAADVGWPLPRRVAAVALARPRRGPRTGLALSPEVLVGLHLDEPCLVVPDPEGPGRMAMLEAGIGRWSAALGPAVDIERLGYSLRLARRALAGPGLVVAADRLPTIILREESEFTGTLVEARLAPLIGAEMNEKKKVALAETFLACLENDFNAVAVATCLHVHAQTIRYRVRHLESLFGEQLHDPGRRLGLHMALHAWLLDVGTK